MNNEKYVHVSIEYACLWMHDAQLRHARCGGSYSTLTGARKQHTHAFSKLISGYALLAKYDFDMLPIC